MNNCDQLTDVIPAYALGIVDPEEQAEIERLLAECPEVMAELDEYTALRDAMMENVQQIEPPASLKVLIVQQAAGVRVKKSSTFTGTSASSRTPILLAAASVAILAIVGIIMAVFLSETPDEKLSDAEIAMQTLLKRDEVARFDVMDVRDDKTGRTPEGVVLCHPDETLVLIQVENFPELAADEVYQIWLWKGDERISGGTFRVDADGNAMILFNAPEDMINYDYVGINREAAPGSLRPMGIPTGRAQLYATGV